MKKISLLIFIGLFTTLMASSLFVDADIKLKDKQGQVIATITKGTKVEVLEKKSDISKIRIKGWSYELEPNDEIFYDMGITVLLSKIEEESLKLRNIIQKKEDKYAEPWMENSIEGWVKTASLTNDFKNLWEVEASYASERCGACHGEPKIENYTAIQFPGLIESMKDTAGMSDEEERIIVNFYQKNKIYNKK